MDNHEEENKPAVAQSRAEGANSNAELAANRGHVWETWDNGEVNIMAWNPADPHNGPRCVKCGYGYCHHCQDGPDEDCPAANV